MRFCFFFFFQAEDGIRDADVTGVQTCALPICWSGRVSALLRDCCHLVEENMKTKTKKTLPSARQGSCLTALTQDKCKQNGGGKNMAISAKVAKADKHGPGG